MPSKPLSALLTLTLLAAPAPALAQSAPRSPGYLERGTLVDTDEGGKRFVPDAESGEKHGRYFRVGGSDRMIFYGIGSHPVADRFWPSFGVRPPLRDVVSASPAGLDRLLQYKDAQVGVEGVVQGGYLVFWGGLLATAGGLAYNFYPGNPREMQPLFLVGTGVAAVAGLVTFIGATAAANENQRLLDAAIEAYNKDLAGRRKLERK